MFRKYQAVFTSRWKALIWAAGICLTAYCTVPSEDQSGAEQGHPQPQHANPWAIHKQ